MSAHEWTRARQRSVRRDATPTTDPPADVSETEAVDTERDEAEESPRAESVPREGPEAVPFDAEPSADPAPEGIADQVQDEAPTEEEVEHAEVEEPAAAETTPVPPAPEPEAPAVPVRQPPPRRRRPPVSTAKQGELPLGLVPVAERPSRRTATETREDLIQRLLDPHLTLQETAKLLDVCPTTVRRYTNRGLLAHYRTPGNQRRFRLSDVLAFMERQGIPAQGLERKRQTLLDETEEQTEAVD